MPVTEVQDVFGLLNEHAALSADQHPVGIRRCDSAPFGTGWMTAIYLSQVSCHTRLHQRVHGINLAIHTRAHDPGDLRASAQRLFHRAAGL